VFLHKAKSLPSVGDRIPRGIEREDNGLRRYYSVRSSQLLRVIASVILSPAIIKKGFDET